MTIIVNIFEDRCNIVPKKVAGDAEMHPWGRRNRSGVLQDLSVLGTLLRLHQGRVPAGVGRVQSHWFGILGLRLQPGLNSRLAEQINQ